MKKSVLLVLSIGILLLISTSRFALADFQYINHYFGIGTSVPPAAIYITDSQGRRTGVDIKQTIDQFGRGTKVQEIPQTDVDEVNIGNDELPLDQPQKSTSWEISVMDRPAESFLLSCVGLKNGIMTLSLNLGFKHGFHSPIQKLKVLTSTGITRQLLVSFDPNSKSLQTQRIVSNSDLLNDVKTTCQLNLITSRHACKHLEEKAKSIRDALEDKRFEEAEELVKGFLHSLGEGSGDGDEDSDDRNAIQEPALTILEEDTETLLAQIKQEEKNHHHGDHGDDGY